MNARHQIRDALRRDIAHKAQRAVRVTVIRAAKRDHRAAPRRNLHELYRRLNPVAARRAAELNPRIARQFRRQARKKFPDEFIAQRAAQIERLQRQLRREMRPDCLHHDGMIVPERERARARETIQKNAAIDIRDETSARLCDREREPPRIRARIGFARLLSPEIIR